MRAKSNNKVIIIRAEKTLIKLILGFFPDTYVHEITLDTDRTGKIIVNLHFIFYEDRGIAIGRGGEYIKLVNEIFKKDVELEYDYDFEIRCIYREL
jgi:transcription antitermination factor NusA-like protein